MGIRESGYRDYGFIENEDKTLIKYIREGQPEDKELLHKCAMEINPSIADELYFSLTKGVSYERLEVITPILYSKVDFYAYRRLLLAKFKDVYNPKSKEC